jgi:hypothetical protein
MLKFRFACFLESEIIIYHDLILNELTRSMQHIA